MCQLILDTKSSAIKQIKLDMQIEPSLALPGKSLVMQSTLTTYGDRPLFHGGLVQSVVNISDYSNTGRYN
jgi:hypothetical protein